MSQANIDMSEEDLDNLCWKIMGWIERFYPPTETAEECTDALHNEDSTKSRESIMSNEEGYHLGCVVVGDDIAEALMLKGIDVVGRAERYDRAMEVRSDTYESEHDYPDPITIGKHGADTLEAIDSERDYPDLIEMWGHRESKFEAIEIEDLDPEPPYELA